MFDTIKAGLAAIAIVVVVAAAMLAQFAVPILAVWAVLHFVFGWV